MFMDAKIQVLFEIPKFISSKSVFSPKFILLKYVFSPKFELEKNCVCLKF